ncbi:DUF3300 domain-containing protein [Rhizobium gallicum]|uniref:DUF3300 domain-containing protein n=1 Tax=Rhizobium gallicum TaxID=56730 RepID=UPI001EF90B1A|nr:DUF3300 domain-containing protein [Rhizobium gallicum]ULJ76060.1 DUF3300 domain-containing protein [Rhizobium gallicum]
MVKSILGGFIALAATSLLPIEGNSLSIAAALAQETAAAAEEQAAPEPLSEDELEVLVARIALYPDALIAVISAASLYPLQIIEAERFLESRAKNPDLKPKEGWDGSVISLLNYPEIVKMMSDDLEWTQNLGQAIAYQQKDVLIAIQQLRDEAVAKGIIKSDDKVKVVHDNDNIVIQSASPEKIYVPQYPPQMLYEPDYKPVPVGYYPEPYPAYYYPGAAFFAGAVTGIAWAAIVDWDNWGVWGGRWDGDINVDCNKCFNNINIDGKIKWNDIDWKNVDRSKLKFDRDQFQKFDRTNIRNNIKANSGNNIRNRAAELNRDRPAVRPGGGSQIKDVRKSTLEGLQSRPGPNAKARPNIDKSAATKARPNVSEPGINRPAAKRPAQVDRPVGKPKVAAKAQNRPRKPSGLGDVSSGRKEIVASRRGGDSMGGGHRGGGRPNKVIKRGGGGRSR